MHIIVPQSQFPGVTTTGTFPTCVPWQSLPLPLQFRQFHSSHSHAPKQLGKDVHDVLVLHIRTRRVVQLPHPPPGAQLDGLVSIATTITLPISSSPRISITPRSVCLIVIPPIIVSWKKPTHALPQTAPPAAPASSHAQPEASYASSSVVSPLSPVEIGGCGEEQDSGRKQPQ